MDKINLDIETEARDRNLSMIICHDQELEKGGDIISLFLGVLVQSSILQDDKENSMVLLKDVEDRIELFEDKLQKHHLEDLKLKLKSARKQVR